MFALHIKLKFSKSEFWLKIRLEPSELVLPSRGNRNLLIKKCSDSQFALNNKTVQGINFLSFSA